MDINDGREVTLTNDWGNANMFEHSSIAFEPMRFRDFVERKRRAHIKRPGGSRVIHIQADDDGVSMLLWKSGAPLK